MKILAKFNTSEKIKALLAARGESQHDLAKVLDVALPTINRRITDGDWRIAEIQAVAAHFSVSVKDLV